MASRYFDGVDDWVRNLGGASALSAGLISIGMWVYSIGNGLSAIFNSSLDGGGGYMGLLVDSNSNYFRVNHYTGSGFVSFDTSSNTFLTNVWNHVVVTYDRTVGTNIPTVYINGVFYSVSGSMTSIAYGEDSFSIGINNIDNRDFLGYLAHFHAFGRILSQNEVVELMYHPFRVQGSLLIHLPLWGESPELDSSGNNIQGDIISGSVRSSLGSPVAA